MNLALIKDGELDEFGRGYVMLRWDQVEVARRIVCERLVSEASLPVGRSRLGRLFRLKPRIRMEKQIEQVVERAFLSLLQDTVRL